MGDREEGEADRHLYRGSEISFLQYSVLRGFFILIPNKEEDKVNGFSKHLLITVSGLREVLGEDVESENHITLELERTLKIIFPNSPLFKEAN